ncbi:MAG: phosphoenolpyruvate carboxykinase (GTP) [Verrucomicrobia bacterium]|nr:phosphoenolpyruvate carboxykinase (GTP) [Verrucomicrobiota bacterium]
MSLSASPSAPAAADVPVSTLLENLPAGLGQTRPAHAALNAWIDDCIALCQPEQVFYCDGSAAEKAYLEKEAQRMGVIRPLNQAKLPGCFYSRSHPQDVARVEHLTFICLPNKEDVGPTNHWADPGEMRAKLTDLLRGAMRGRTMYVVPYLMGPKGSPISRVGVEITDSIYVVLNMRIMSRMGQVALDTIGAQGDFNRGLHSTLDMNPERRYIAHFPQTNEIISVGSGYGGNALLGKKCFALRIGSYLAQQQGWMAEHMLLMAVESPEGKKHYIAAAFPSACGKTNFAMLIPPASYQGWKVTTIGDDIAWMEVGKDGRLYAINPEAGYFGVAPGTNYKSNPNAMKSIEKDTIYTNVALTPDGDVWWEGKDGAPPAQATDWLGRPWTPDSKEKAAHPNSRFTAPATNNPVLAEEVEWPQGVPISAIIFGGRRAGVVPLVYQANDWTHGVYLGATMSSETTAAAAGAQGQVRRDPMAMLPFCGYHMGDYFQHWLDMGRKLTNPPLVFRINWFRKGPDGRFLWPGFGENMRVVEWIIDRCEGKAGAKETPIGAMPRREDFNLAGLQGVSDADFDELLDVPPEGWRKAAEEQAPFFESLAPRFPQELEAERQKLLARLK